MPTIPYYPGEPKEYSFKKLYDTVNGEADKLSAVINGEASGRATFDGTGAQVDFVIPHGLGAAPTSVFITPGSADAAALSYATADATNITVTFTTAPDAGTDNVVLNWQVSK